MSNNINNVDSNTMNTNTFFNGYFTQPVNYSPDVYGQVYGFFLNRTGATETAKVLTTTVLSLTSFNNIDPMSVIADLAKTSNITELKKTAIAFFNATKKPTSKIGFNNGKKHNYWVNRTIIA